MVRIVLCGETRKALTYRLRQAYAAQASRLTRRIHALLWLAEGKSVREVAETLDLGEQTVRDWLHAFILQSVASLFYRPSPGRPPRLTGSQRQELKRLIGAGPEEAGYPSACWTAGMVADLIKLRFKVEYNPHYVCQLLASLGYSFQKARFSSDHLSDEEAIVWPEETWPEILRVAKEKQAAIFFGDEAGFAQWGSLSYTWAPIGVQPTVKTSGIRRAYRVFGLLDCFKGRLIQRGTAGKLNSESYREFLSWVLTVVEGHLIVIQDNASYHTSGLMEAFYKAHADRLTIYQLPPYSPDLNPIEPLWKQTKKRATHLRWFPKFAGLMAKVDEALTELAAMPAELRELVGVYREWLPLAA